MKNMILKSDDPYLSYPSLGQTTNAREVQSAETPSGEQSYSVVLVTHSRIDTYEGPYYVTRKSCALPYSLFTWNFKSISSDAGPSD